MIPTTRFVLVMGAFAPLFACARYRAEPRTAPDRALVTRAAPATPVTFEGALRLLLEQNPELLALRAHAAAVNLRPNETVLTAEAELADGAVTQASIGADVLALFGLGVRPAQRALAVALQQEAVALHHERARELAEQLAVAFAREAALLGLVTEVVSLDARRYVEAGLAAESDLAESESSRRGWVIERRLVDLERRRNGLSIARLLGVAPEHPVPFVATDGDWPPVPAPSERALLFSRADVQRQAAAVAVADRVYRVALARQFPNLGIALGATFDPLAPLSLFEASLPLGAAAEVSAAQRAREARARDLEAGVLAALHDAARARLDWEQSAEEVSFWQNWWEAKHGLVKAARQRTATDARELTMAVHLENEEIEAARDLREALLHRAQARVGAAVAAGWPGPTQTGPVPATCSRDGGGAR